MRNKLFIVAVFLLAFGDGGIASTIMVHPYDLGLYLFYGIFGVIGMGICYNRLTTKCNVEVRSFK